MSEIQDTKKWANPTPAGLVALGIATFVFFALLSGAVEPSARLIGGVWLLGGFVVQLVVALIDLNNKNVAGGNTFLFFSSFFMLVSGTLLILKWWIADKGLEIDTRIEGYAWIVLTLCTILWTPAFFKSTKLLGLILIFVDIALPFITLMDLKIMPHTYSMIPAICMLIAGILSIYLSAAMVVNETFGKKVFPIPGPFVK